MSKRIVPDGERIKARRVALRIPQKKFAALVGIKERTLRYIEDENKTVTPAKLHALAIQLKTTQEDLAFDPASREKHTAEANLLPASVQQFELRKQTSASELLSACQLCELEFEILDDINTRDAAMIEEFLILIESLCHSKFGEFFGYAQTSEPHFPTFGEGTRFRQIHQRARLQELLQVLGTYGIGVFVGSYWFTRRIKESTEMEYEGVTVPVPEQIREYRIAWIKFAKTEKTAMAAPYNRGLIQNNETQRWEEDMADGPTLIPF